MKKHIKTYLFSAVIFTASLLFSLALAEFYLRFIAFPGEVKNSTILPNKYYTWQPYLKILLCPEYMPGVYNPSTFSTNKDGIRGPDMGDGAYRILCVGGSTTECSYLDDTETWPHLLREELNKEEFPVWVGNAGKSGLNTWHHLLQAEFLLPQLGVDMVLVLCGINDLTFFLSHPTVDIKNFSSSDKFQQKLLDLAFVKSSPIKQSSFLPWHRKLFLWKRVRFFFV